MIKKIFPVLKNFDSKKQLTVLTMSLLIIFFSIFIIYPLLFSIFGSFYDWNPIKGIFNFVGLKNYIELPHDIVLLKTLSNTFLFVVVTLILRIVFALIIAVLINNSGRFKSFFRAIYFLPVVTSIFAISLVWKVMYNPVWGIFNSILRVFGLEGFRWLNDTNLALISIIIMVVWKDFGYAMVLFLAGLTSIPKQCIEAANIDGANKIHVFWYITLPLLKPTTIFVIIISTIEHFQTFVPMYVMTKGGPGYLTYTITYKIFSEAFIKYNFGYASSIAVILFLIIMVISLLQLRIMRMRWRY